MPQALTLTWLKRLLGVTQPGAEIRWNEVVQIEAMGSDALGPFEIAVTFMYADGSEATLFAHHHGYDEIVKKLHQRFPTVPATWYAEMMSRPEWHVERVLYSREARCPLR